MFWGGRGKRKEQSLIAELAQLVIDLARLIDDLARLWRRMQGKNEK
jgi:hypothetical protein